MKMTKFEGIQDEITYLLARGGVDVRYNEFTHCISFSRAGVPERPITDIDRAYMAVLFHDAGVKGTSSNVVTATVDLIADSRKYHPVRDYLAGLKWDRVPRVETWLIDHLKTDDSPYIRAVGKRVLVAAVRRVRQPGCKFDELLTLVGREGVGKSKAVKALVPVSDWFSDSLPLGDEPKETIEKTRGVWICEAAELIGTTKSSVAEIKSALSRQVDGPVRLAYARESVSRARQFVPIATTNESAFLQSMTGDRRFWPVVVRWAYPERIAELRDQLWAEAAEIEASGFPLQLPEELWPLARKAQEEFSNTDPYEEELTMEKVGMQITLTEILARLDIPRSQRSSALGTRICNIMTKNGFRRIRAQKDGVRGTYYKYITPLDELDYREETAPVEPDEPEGYEYQTPEEIERDKKMLEAEFADHDEEDYL